MRSQIESEHYINTVDVPLTPIKVRGMILVKKCLQNSLELERKTSKILSLEYYPEFVERNSLVTLAWFTQLGTLGLSGLKELKSKPEVLYSKGLRPFPLGSLVSLKVQQEFLKKLDFYYYYYYLSHLCLILQLSTPKKGS